MSEETALARQAPTLLDRVGQYSDGDTLRDALSGIGRLGNMLLPISRIAEPPPGFAVTISAVLVDVETESYRPVNGDEKRALSKPALDRIAAAAGVTWLPDQFRRLDDGSDPNVYECRVVCQVRDLDGSVRVVVGEKRLDLRDDSPMTAQVLGYKNNVKSLRQTRAFIAEHCASKARNRAIRTALGIRQTFSPEEIERPFVAAKLTFTGRTGDPETDRMIAIMAASKELGMAPEMAAAICGQFAAPKAAPPVALFEAEPEPGEPPQDAAFVPDVAPAPPAQGHTQADDSRPPASAPQDQPQDWGAKAREWWAAQGHDPEVLDLVASLTTPHVSDQAEWARVRAGAQKWRQDPNSGLAYLCDIQTPPASAAEMQGYLEEWETDAESIEPSAVWGLVRDRALFATWLATRRRVDG